MKIIIAGIGKVGASLARLLCAQGNDVTLIDQDCAVLEAAIEQNDVMSVAGNCVTRNTLAQAGITEAELLIAATGEDEVNLLCCMVAHALNPGLHTIARIRNPEYTDQVWQMRDMFALSLTVNPERRAAQEMERLLKYPGFLKRDTFAKGRAEIVELRVERNSLLCHVMLKDLERITKCKVLVCAVLRHGEAIVPAGEFILEEGDRIFVTAPVNELANLLRSLKITTRRVRRVLICGGGTIGYYLAAQLCRDGIAVQLLERDEKKCEQLAARLPQADIVCADAANLQLLESEGIAKCDALVTLTGMDELNIILALYGKNLGVPQVITKLSHFNDSMVLGGLPLGSVVCPDELCCSTIVRYVRAMKNQAGAAQSVHFIADRHAEAAEFCVDQNTMHCGRPLKQLSLRKNVLIASITRHGKTIIPDGDACFMVGDNVVVVTTGKDVVYQFGDIFA